MPNAPLAMAQGVAAFQSAELLRQGLRDSLLRLPVF